MGEKSSHGMGFLVVHFFSCVESASRRNFNSTTLPGRSGVRTEQDVWWADPRKDPHLVTFSVRKTSRMLIPALRTRATRDSCTKLNAASGASVEPLRTCVTWALDGGGSWRHPM